MPVALPERHSWLQFAQSPAVSRSSRARPVDMLPRGSRVAHSAVAVRRVYEAIRSNPDHLAFYLCDLR